jgi:hypothetical protein
VVQEGTVVEHETRIIEGESLTLIRRGRDDDLGGNALIFKLRTCP